MTFTALGFLLALAPLLALLAFLAGDVYPGERAIERLRRLLDRIASPRARSARPGVGPPRPRTIRGGRLIACSLAGRGPPARIRPLRGEKIRTRPA